MSHIENFDIRAYIIQSIVEAFGTLLFVELEPTDIISPESIENTNHVGSVSFTGDAAGLVSIHVGDYFIRQLAAKRLGIPVDEFDDDQAIRDIVGELGNIAGGGLKSALRNVGLACALSMPSFSNPTNIKVESANVENNERFAFTVGDSIVFLELALIIKHPFRRPTGAQLPDANPQPKPASPADQATPSLPPPSSEPQRSEDFDLGLLLDIPLELRVELGRTRIQIRELLRLKPGAAVKLLTLDGEPVDILVNDTLIAKGEVVVQNEKYGIRVTEITSRMDRIRSVNT
jgi:flagellar motor switch protein FliN